MLKQNLRIVTFILFLCFGMEISAQVTQVGNGSYTTTFPGTDEAGRNGFPPGTPNLSGNALGKPVPTNDWWSLLLKGDHVGNLFNYPMTLKTTNAGLVATYIPWGVIDDQEPILVGVDGLNAARASVSDYSDWTVTMDWSERFNATSGIGMPFLYFNKADDEVARVTVNLGNVTVSNEMITVTDARNGADFVIYAPVGSTWEQDGNTYTSTLNGKNYWSMAMLPQDVTDVALMAEAYKAYAYVFPANTAVSWDYNEATSTMTTDFVVTPDIKEGEGTNVLIGLLPHQWGNLAAGSAQPEEDSYNSVRGELKMLAGNTFSVENSFHGILPTLPYLSNYSDGFSVSALSDKVALLENDQLNPWTDSYNEGQEMNRLIQTARIADLTGDIEARDKLIATVKERLEDWLSAEASEVAFVFYYNSDWTTMLGYPAGHGQDSNINDHHFHWGYFIHAAAFMEQFEPGWADEWGDMVNHLIRDASSPNRNDELFPFLRNFSPYAGHCWANGFASFPQGNDQESTSESMQFHSSLIHWGSITGNDEIRDLGIYLYTTEQTAVEDYWFDIHERVFQPSQQFSLVSRVWGNSYDNGTFWTNDIEASYGIELYPIHGGSMYLGHPLEYAEKLWAEIEANTDILDGVDHPNLWHDTYWKYLAFIDAEKAIELYDDFTERNLKFGVSDAQTYYWLHSMNAMGQVDATITADHPIAVAFQKDGEYTYVAHNYSQEDITVTFSDGFQLAVGAGEFVTNRDVDITGTLGSSFSSAFVGGSVVLQVDAEEGTPTKVGFYQEGELLGEVTEALFTLVAEDLDAGVFGFYARVYDGEAFGVTNSISVEVGEQLPFDGTPSAIPGTIEAGHYDVFEGGQGQGIAYADGTADNFGGYRPDEAVDALFSNAEGATVGWIGAGEWLEYTVEVEEAGLYDLAFRFASNNPNGGGPFHLELNDEPITEAISVGFTNGWDTWQSRTISDLPMPAGEHILKVAFSGGEFNLARMTFTRVEDLPYSHPVADAGENVIVKLPDSTGALDGSASSDADGDDLTYLWTQINGPSVITFSDNTVANPDISDLVEGVYKCELTVSDGEYTATDEVLIIVTEENVAPQVAITAPADGAVFEVGATIEITASASDLEGTVILVEFFDGDTKLGEDSSAPFSFTWDDATVGSHELTARATDNEGAINTSDEVTISINEEQVCTQTLTEALEGSFSVGYKATYRTIGTNITITFELLDEDKTGVVAFLRRESPFEESPMENVTGNVFSATLEGQTPGSTISYGAKFAFTGGQAVTQYVSYEVGTSCEEQAQLSMDNATMTLAENSPEGTVVGTPSVSYTGTAALTYTIMSGNGAGAFGINANTGELSVASSAPLDFETTPSFSLGLSVTDGEVTAQATVTINLTDEDEVITSIDDERFDIDLFPNPVKDWLTIDWEAFSSASVRDLYGREVIFSTEKEMDVSALPNGIYLVLIKGTGDKLAYRKLMKQ